MRKILVFTGSRANLSSSLPIVSALSQHDAVEVVNVLGAAGTLERYGRVHQAFYENGFSVDASLGMIVEGETPESMAKSVGLGVIEVSVVLAQISPHLVVLIGDRFDVLSVAVAASMMNIPIAHTMGGEISGTIDESIRHVISKFAQIHFPANAMAARRIRQLGENPNNIYAVGCPRMDYIAGILKKPESDFVEDYQRLPAVGEEIDLAEPFLITLFHPVTTEFAQARKQTKELLRALNTLAMPTIMIWPNADAGSDEIAKTIRTFREEVKPSWLRVHKNLPFDVYIFLMNRCKALVGNSSSGIREAAFIGCPVVNVGSRQNGRDRASNVVDVPCACDEIIQAIRKQIAKEKYPRSELYGLGNSAHKIAKIIVERDDIGVQKTFTDILD